MIDIQNIEISKPYDLFKSFYFKALSQNQPNIDALAISSFNQPKKEVNSRFVNLKYIKKNNWTFFLNYSSNKSLDFNSHQQISALFFWNKINLQIRMNATIKEINKVESDNYFLKRDEQKNALAISSMQSQKISSYKKVKDKFNIVKNNSDLTKRPKYWGGYSFTPYYFEFWEGQDSRVNKRKVYELKNKKWESYYLEP